MADTRADSGSPGLSTLLAGFPPERFLADHWPSEPLWVRGDPARLRGLVDLPPFQQVAALVRVPARSIIAQLVTVEGSLRTPAVDAEVALKLYEAGHQVYLNEVDPPSPEFRQWLRGIAQDLRLPPDTVTCSIFACRREHPGTPPHFDPQGGFVVQVQGRKRWRIAANRVVDHPTFAHILGDPFPLDQLHMLSGPASESVMDLAQEIEMEPGSVLFLPAGYWHATESIDDSIHLDLMVSSPCWGDVILGALRRMVELDIRYRAPVAGFGISDAADERAGQHLGRLLRDLAEAIGRVHPSEILEAAGFPGASHTLRYQLAANVRVEIGEPEAGGRLRVRIDRPGGQHEEMAVDRSFADLWHWILDRRGTFASEEASERVPNAPLVAVQNLLEHLFVSGVLDSSIGGRPRELPRRSAPLSRQRSASLSSTPKRR